MSSWGGMSDPGRGGACRTRGKHVRPSCRGRLRGAKPSTGRCFLSGDKGVFVHQSSGR